jgi:hypothetical protein
MVGLVTLVSFQEKLYVFNVVLFLAVDVKAYIHNMFYGVTVFEGEAKSLFT